MRKRLAIGVLSAAMATSLIGAAGASAAVEFGNPCVGEEAAAEYTLATVSSAQSLPNAAPSAGVITKLKVNNSVPFPFSVPTTVKTLRPAGGEDYTVIGQAALMVATGETVADARLPVQAGDLLAMHGEPFTYEGAPQPGLSLYCETTAPGSVLGASLSSPGPGSTITIKPVADGAVPLVAVLEPDADGDGYGDETQDGCPQSAMYQTACPVVVLDTFPLVGGNAVRVLVATSLEAPVKVAGTVKLRKGGAVKLGAKAKTVQPGKLVSFKLNLNAKLKKKLKELPPGKKLRLKIVARATNVAGRVSSDKAIVKLKGRG